ncbi:MAG: type IV secretory system conjugative DNA transfer family protein [Leadbetterella sp.]|nr:type IV secretory system conjugative DNA transfer family protein [Leadbetterella sp.]
MDYFDLDTPIIELASAYGSSNWTIKDSFEGIFIAGGIGSGKSTGSGRMLALKYLSNGYGGLVLTAKPEKETWLEYCRLAGREADLLVIEPNGQHCFNFLQYESAHSKDSLTENIVEVLKTVIRAGQEKEGSKDDPFWETALDMLIFNVIDLCRLAYGTLSIQNMFDIVQTIPKGHENLQSETTQGEVKAFQKAFELARSMVTKKIDAWVASFTPEQENILLKDNFKFESELLDAIPEARLLKFLDQFFFDSFINLSEKTRSIIDFTFSGFLFRLLREPVYSLFCRNDSTLTPEDCLNGKIILINLPVKLYHKVGRDCQILFKYIWQRAMEKRSINSCSRPVFLWADEAQNFLHEHDADFQATARSSRIATVYISQNLPNLYACMGGAKAEFRVKSFLGTLGTKIFHANADIETNRYSSELIGDAFFEDASSSVTVSKDFSQTKGKSLKLERLVRPEDFVRLKTGGPKNNFHVEGFLHKQGDPIHKGLNHTKITFNQNFLI